MTTRSSAAAPGRENPSPRWARPSSARRGSGRPEPSTQHSLRQDHQPSRSLSSPQHLGARLPKGPAASRRGHARRARTYRNPHPGDHPRWWGGKLRSPILKSGQPVGRGGFPASVIDTAASDVRGALWSVRGPHPNRNSPTEIWALGPSRCTDPGLRECGQDPKPGSGSAPTRARSGRSGHEPGRAAGTPRPQCDWRSRRSARVAPPEPDPDLDLARTRGAGQECRGARFRPLDPPPPGRAPVPLRERADGHGTRTGTPAAKMRIRPGSGMQGPDDECRSAVDTGTRGEGNGVPFIT